MKADSNMSHSRRRRDGSGGQAASGPQVDTSVRAASYARFSSALQDEKSNADQQRMCREIAKKVNGHRIASELEFSDSAVSGTKLRRDGLDRLLAAAEAGEIDVLYFHSLSRLSRESVITLPLLKKLVYNHGMRVISVTEGIDSRDTSWDLIAHVMSIVHEQYLKTLAANILRGQEGALELGFSLGDYCFGYGSEPIPGSEQGRRGRNAKPRKIYIKDPKTAAWLERIFRWFVHEQRSLRWICRALNRLGAPKDHRAKTTKWHHQYLSRLLSNRKYVGWWAWGKKKNIRDPLTGKIRQEERAPEECERWLRHFPHLQLIDNDTFDKAQALLAENKKTAQISRGQKGKFKKGTRGTSSKDHPRHLLSQLIECGECGRTFHVGGKNGKYLSCPGYTRGACSCQTQLHRRRAEQMILDQIGQRILANPAWREQVQAELLAAWERLEATVPADLAAAREKLADLEKRITRLLDQVENGSAGPELNERLTQRRAEKRDLMERIQKLERAEQRRPPQPTPQWVDEQLAQLGTSIAEFTPAAAHALRQLVGGKIVVHEIREPGKKRYYLQGRFNVASGALAAQLSGSATDDAASFDQAALEEHIVVVFRQQPKIVAQSERAKALYDQGLMVTEIAQELRVSRARATAVLKYWFESRGLAMPDGRSRRGTLDKKHLQAPLYQQIADQVMELCAKGLLLQEIAEALGCDRNTVTAAYNWWHVSRGLPVPDGRTRRKSLERKCAKKRKRKVTDHADGSDVSGRDM